jgi:hypothetical protein
MRRCYGGFSLSPTDSKCWKNTTTAAAQRTTALKSGELSANGPQYGEGAGAPISFNAITRNNPTIEKSVDKGRY